MAKKTNYVVTTRPKYDPHEVAQKIKAVNPSKITILGTVLFPESKRLSGVITLKCSPEQAEEIKKKKIEGIRHFTEQKPRTPK